MSEYMVSYQLPSGMCGNRVLTGKDARQFITDNWHKRKSYSLLRVLPATSPGCLRDLVLLA